MEMTKKRTNKKFSSQEDAKLKQLVKQYGQNAWEEVSTRMNGRNIRQCKDRWFYYLSPKVRSDPWTEEDDAKLIKLVGELNGKWVMIAKRFKGRNDTQIKNRWNTLKKLHSQSIVPHKPAETSPKTFQPNEETSFEKTLFDLFNRCFQESIDLFNWDDYYTSIGFL